MTVMHPAFVCLTNDRARAQAVAHTYPHGPLSAGFLCPGNTHIRTRASTTLKKTAS